MTRAFRRSREHTCALSCTALYARARAEPERCECLHAYRALPVGVPLARCCARGAAPCRQREAPGLQVAAARRQGQRIVGEAVTSGLALDESAMWHPDFDTAAKYVMSPPIRSVEHQAALRAALAGGSLQLVGTDHAAWNSTQKRFGRHDFRRMPNGVNGIEERLHVVWDTMVRARRLSCTLSDKFMSNSIHAPQRTCRTTLG